MGMPNVNNTISYAPLAQLDRALVYGTKGQEFESLTAHHIKNESYVIRFFILQIPFNDCFICNFMCAVIYYILKKGGKCL